MSFYKKLKKSWDLQNSLLCVGLDPEPKKFPESIRKLALPIFEFNKKIIETCAPYVCAFKPQIAHYAAHGAEKELELTIQFVQNHFPHIVCILDAKRSDIGSTAKYYAREAFERYKADAVTVNPYLGGDSLEPFLAYQDKGVIVLCRTSNAGAGELQDLKVDGKKLFEVVAEKAATKWNENHNIALVVGATYPGELKKIRNIVGDLPLLVPGVGAQGADLASVVTQGLDSNRRGLMISASRAVIYAASDDSFATAAATQALTYRDEINRQRFGAL